MQSLLKPVVTAEKAWELLEEKVSCRYKSVKVRRRPARARGAESGARGRGTKRRRPALPQAR